MIIFVPTDGKREGEKLRKFLGNARMQKRKYLKAVAGLVAILAIGTLAIKPVQASEWTIYPRSVGYWKTHNIYATVPALRDPWPIVEDVELCDRTFFEIVNTPPEGDAWLILAQQWIVALLNAMNGCELPPDVYQALWDSEELLWDSCGSIDPSEREEAIGLAELFTAYNEGLM